MANYLQRLGRFSFRRRRSVLALWLGLLVLAGVGAATLSGPTSDGLSMPGTQSQQALDLLNERFPEAAASGAVARVVFAAPDGAAVTDPQAHQAVTQLVDTLRGAAQVASVTDPYTAGQISPDGRVGFLEATYSVAASDVSTAAHSDLTAALDATRGAGLTVEAGGTAVESGGGPGIVEVLGLAVAAVVLLMTLGSLVAAGLPLAIALISVGIAISSITAATGFINLGSSTSVLALMLGLAVAIDYSLFILSRYRNELSDGRSHEDAVGRAVGTAGSAVFFAGMTVVIALVGLAVVNIPVLTQMGIAAAGAVIIAMLVALSLLPALLGFAGDKVLPGRRRGRRARRAATRAAQAADARSSHRAPAAVPPAADPEETGAGLRWARFVVRRPGRVLAVSIAGLAIIALPALSMKLALPNDGRAAAGSAPRLSYDMLADGFGEGFNGPLMIVLDGAGRPGELTAAGARAVTEISRLPDVASVTDPRTNAAGDTAVFRVIPRSGPSSPQTADLLAAVRDLGPGLAADTGVKLAVTGQTALDTDMSKQLGGAMLPYLAVVVGLAVILLGMVFRSVLVPLKAALGFLLTIGATLGAVVAVFQWGWLAGLFGVDGQTGPIMSLVPTVIIGIVFGLAMDYQVFLVTRMREAYVHGAEPSESVVVGFGHSARVVTAAAIIMISVFAGFILAPEALTKQIGFALAFGVLVDAFVVRMTIVPAVLALVGRAAWWLPTWLDRILPNVDVEGAKLDAPTAGGQGGHPEHALDGSDVIPNQDDPDDTMALRR
jgi:RND superfamily putative drug exporter